MAVRSAVARRCRSSAGARRFGAGQVPADVHPPRRCAPPTCAATRSVMTSRPSSIPAAPRSRRQRLLREPAQRGRHHRRIVVRLPGRASARAPVRAARCARSSCSRRGLTRGIEDRALVEREYLAERVVAAHRHDADGPLHQQLDVRVERDHAMRAQALRRARGTGAASRGGMNGPSTMTAASGMSGIVLVGAQHPVDDRHAVVAAAHGDQHVRLLADRMRTGRRSDCGTARLRYPV